MKGLKLVSNFAAFQMGWFACVFGAANDRPIWGLAAVAAAVLLHLSLARFPAREVRVLAVAALAGAFFDSLLFTTGWVNYPNGLWLGTMAPWWIIALWVLFGTTLNASMGWLRGRQWLAAPLGAVAGPLSYLAGNKLGAIEFVQPIAALVALALIWGFALPMMMRLASALNGYAPDPELPAVVMRDWRETRHV